MTVKFSQFWWVKLIFSHSQLVGSRQTTRDFWSFHVQMRNWAYLRAMWVWYLKTWWDLYKSSTSVVCTNVHGQHFVLVAGLLKERKQLFKRKLCLFQYCFFLWNKGRLKWCSAVNKPWYSVFLCFRLSDSLQVQLAIDHRIISRHFFFLFSKADLNCRTDFILFKNKWVQWYCKR